MELLQGFNVFALRAFFLLRVCLVRIYKCDCVQAQATHFANSLSTLVTWNHGRHEGNEEGYEEGGSSCSTKEGDEGHEEVRSCLSMAGRPIDQRPAVM